MLVQAESGLLSVTGTADAPARCGVSIADIAAGMYAYSGTLMALLRRARRPGAARASTSRCSSARRVDEPADAISAKYGGAPPARSGASHPTIAPYGPHRAGDGREVLFGIQNDREWTRFCADVLAQPELARDERFVDNTRASRIASS